MVISFSRFVKAYNAAAKKRGFRETTSRGLVRRLNNADCNFSFAGGRLTIEQLKALFIYSYKGTQDHKDKVMGIFEDVSEKFQLPISFVELAAYVESVQDREVKAITNGVKKMMDKLVFKVTLSKVNEKMAYHKQNALDTDEKRIAAARDAIFSLNDKAMLVELFTSKALEEEIAG